MNILTDTSLSNAAKVLFSLTDSRNISIEQIDLRKTIGKTANAVVVTGMVEFDPEIEYNDPSDTTQMYDMGIDYNSNIPSFSFTSNIETPKSLTNAKKLKFILYVNKTDVQHPTNICKYRLDITSNNNTGLSLLISKNKSSELTTISATAMEAPSSQAAGYTYDELELIKTIEWRGNSSAVTTNTDSIWVLLPGSLYTGIIAIGPGYINMGMPVSSAMQEVVINVATSEVSDPDGLFLSDNLVAIAEDVEELNEAIESIDEQIADIPDEIQEAVSSTVEVLSQQFVSR